MIDQKVPLARPSKMAVTRLMGETRQSSRMTRRPFGGKGGGSAFVMAMGTSASIMKLAAAENSASLLASKKRKVCWPSAEPAKFEML